MARIPTEADIEAMSDDEVDAYLASARQSQGRWRRWLTGQRNDALLEDVCCGTVHADRIDASGAEDHDGSSSSSLPCRNGVAVAAWRRPYLAPPSYGVVLLIAALIGMWASWQLVVSEIMILREPLAALTCDINPLVSCRDTLTVWQANVLGIPNAVVGLAAFSLLVFIGVLTLTGMGLPRWLWWGLSVGCLVALSFVAWLVSISVFTFHALCPFCMVVWTMTIVISCSTWGHAARGGALGLSDRINSYVWSLRWWCAAALGAVILAVITTAMWDRWVALLS